MVYAIPILSSIFNNLTLSKNSHIQFLYYDTFLDIYKFVEIDLLEVCNYWISIDQKEITMMLFRCKMVYIPLHYVSCRAIDHFIRRFPTELNILKDDGFTPLHLAAFNNHIDVVTSLAEHVSV